MAYDPRFGPNAQTPGQRAYVLQQLQAACPRLRALATPQAVQLFARYVGGELTWPEVQAALDDAPRTAHSGCR
jgi:hypothetical protein